VPPTVLSHKAVALLSGIWAGATHASPWPARAQPRGEVVRAVAIQVPLGPQADARQALRRRIAADEGRLVSAD